jgi:hypothetical protein
MSIFVRPLGALWRLTALVPSLFLTAGATQPVPDGWSTTPDRGAAALLFFICFVWRLCQYTFVRSCSDSDMLIVLCVLDYFGLPVFFDIHTLNCEYYSIFLFHTL